MSGNGKSAPVLITGGAGFIGANLADHLLSAGEQVLIFDNLSRDGVARNWQWLHEKHGNMVRLEIGDIRDSRAVRRAVRHASAIFHFAAQVAVTGSLENPALDFEINALGTMNLLDAWRHLPSPPPLIFTSTNKVYGGLAGVSLRSACGRYEPVDVVLHARGIDESQPLDFYSPYGCSKGAADQYVLDHARTFGLPALVFRMSCIYGPHQFGTEDQGWVAHFLLQAREGRTLTIYGDGQQVRDVLFIQDLLRAFVLARENLPRLSGQAFNIGGGPQNTVSLLELVELIGVTDGETPRLEFTDWRPGDQRFYVTNFGKFQRATGWSPQVDVATGLRRLAEWLQTSARNPVKTLIQI